MNQSDDPHAQGRLVTRGPAPAAAAAAVVAVHGRGASPESILALASPLGLPSVHWAAPEAAGNSWYPCSFLEKIALNEPGLTFGLRRIDTILTELAGAGLPAAKTMLLGFSQGACLALEYAARHPGRFAAVAGLSGGLVGPDGTDRNYPGSLDGIPVFIGCSDVDPHIPLARLRETERVFRRLGASVVLRLYPGFGHGVNDDELEELRAMLLALTGQRSG